MRARPSLIARLIVAPGEAVHATAAFLHLAPEAAKPDSEVAVFIDDIDPRALLRAALPDCPRRLYRALDTAGDRVLSKRFYERLGTICRGPFADAFLEGDLIENRIAFYEALSKMDPAVAAMRNAIRENNYIIDAVDCLTSFLRAHGVLRDGEMRLPPKARMPAVARRIRTALGRIEAPHPGFAAPAPFHFVKNSGELQRLAQRFENCLRLSEWNAAKYHINLIERTTVILHSDDPLVLVALHRVARNAWQLEQVCGPKNVSPPPGVRSTLIRDLTAAGLRIVTTDPHSALARIEHEARRGREAEDDLGDDEGDDDEDGIAA